MSPSDSWGARGKTKHIKIVFLSLVLIGLHSCSKDEAFEGDDPVAVDQLDVSKQSLEDQALFEYALYCQNLQPLPLSRPSIYKKSRKCPTLITSDPLQFRTR